jgi:hypothetical protein
MLNFQLQRRKGRLVRYERSSKLKRGSDTLLPFFWLLDYTSVRLVKHGQKELLVYTVTVTALKYDTTIQDPYPTEDKVVIRCKVVGVPVVTGLQDSQYDRILPQLITLQASGLITWEAIDGPASQVTNDSSVPGVSVQDALNNLAGGVTGASDMFFSGGRAGSTITNVYLRGPGAVPMNLAGYVIPFDAKIVAVSAATAGAETWVFEVRKNNLTAPIASLSLVGVERGYDDSLSIDIDAGDELQFYCNGTNINAPSGSVVVRRR